MTAVWGRKLADMYQSADALAASKEQWAETLDRCCDEAIEYAFRVCRAENDYPPSLATFFSLAASYRQADRIVSTYIPLAGEKEIKQLYCPCCLEPCSVHEINCPSCYWLVVKEKLLAWWDGIDMLRDGVRKLKQEWKESGEDQNLSFTEYCRIKCLTDIKAIADRNNQKEQSGNTIFAQMGDFFNKLS